MYDTYGENKQADRFHARYLKKKAAFNITYGNQNTTVFPKNEDRTWYYPRSASQIDYNR
jgi:hypothetical protein